MKEWPKDPETVPLEDLVQPLRNVLSQVYWMEPDLPGRVTYEGYNIGDQHVNMPADHTLSRKGLKYNNDEQGRDYAETLLCVAVQLGIEQGRRLERQKIQPTNWQAWAQRKLDGTVCPRCNHDHDPDRSCLDDCWQCGFEENFMDEHG